MGIKSLPAIIVLFLSLGSFAQGQQNLPYSSSPVAGSFPSAQGMTPNSPYSGTGQGYNRPQDQQGGYPVQSQPLNPGTDAAGWPNYPYPQYHNPYYGGVPTRDLVSGTIEWLVTLPSTVMDRFSGFMDRSFFPQSPATQGGDSQKQTPTSPGTQANPGAVGSLPPASVYAPSGQ
jgi:hypothetical protein